MERSLRQVKISTRSKGNRFYKPSPLKYGSFEAFKACYATSRGTAENCARNILIEDNQIITFTISIGLSSKNSSNDSIDKILHKADESLYEAKNTGKNRLIRNRF